MSFDGIRKCCEIIVFRKTHKDHFFFFFCINENIYTCGASRVAQKLKHLPGMRETQVWSLNLEDPLEKEMTTHSRTLVWRIPKREEPGRLQSMGLQSRTQLSDFTFTFFLSIIYKYPTCFIDLICLSGTHRHYNLSITVSTCDLTQVFLNSFAYFYLFQYIMSLFHFVLLCIIMHLFFYRGI